MTGTNNFLRSGGDGAPAEGAFDEPKSERVPPSSANDTRTRRSNATDVPATSSQGGVRANTPGSFSRTPRAHAVIWARVSANRPAPGPRSTELTGSRGTDASDAR